MNMRLIICSIISVLLTGCYMQPVVSKTHWYPLDRDYESADYLLYVEVSGERGKAYTATNTKNVIITIFKDNNKYLVRDYVCKAASLEWEVVWNELDDLNILFFDFPEGISIYDEKVVELPAKQIFSLRFTFDKQNDRFSEHTISPKIVQNVKNPNRNAQ